MATLKDTLNYPGSVDSFIESAAETDIPSELYEKLRNERGDAELSDEEQSEVWDVEERLTANVEPCEDCGHYFTEGEGYYHFDGNTTEVLCETCFKQHFPTDLDWDKHIVQVEEDLSDAEFAELLDTLSEDELKERAAEDVEDSDAMCYYSEA